MQEQLYILLKKLVLKNNIHLNFDELKLQLLSHPSYPSLYSFTGVLNHFGVPNIALKVPTNKETLEQLPPCFISNVTLETGEALVLVENKKNDLEITVNANTKMKWSTEKFLSKWNAIILAIEKDESIQETTSSLYSSKLKWVLYSMLGLVVAYFIFSAATLFLQVHFTLSIIGVVLSVFIIKQELGLQSTTANNFCNLSKNTSCDDVLNSKGAKIFGFFKMSDLCIMVFSTYVLNGLLFALNGTGTHVLFYILATASMPVVAFSIYYQYKVIKKWCPLCLGIAGILLIQFGALFIGGEIVPSLTFDTKSSLLFVMGILTIIALWSFLKPILKKSTAFEKLEIEHHKFKRNFSIFRQFLEKKDPISNIGTIPGELVFGNKNAPLELMVVTSPFCHFCKAAHTDIEHLLSIAGKNLKITIRFNLNPLEKENPLYKIASQLLHIYQTKGETAGLLALKVVYHETVDLEKWIEKHEIKHTESYDSILVQQQEWCIANAINFTPALFLNGYTYPQEYDRKDIAYFIDELIEQYSIARVSSKKIMAY